MKTIGKWYFINSHYLVLKFISSTNTFLPFPHLPFVNHFNLPQSHISIKLLSRPNKLIQVSKQVERLDEKKFLSRVLIHTLVYACFHFQFIFPFFHFIKKLHNKKEEKSKHFPPPAIPFQPFVKLVNATKRDVCCGVSKVWFRGRKWNSLTL